MLKKVLYLLILVGCNQLTLGQERLGISRFGIDSSNYAAGFYTEYAIGSTALTNRLYLDFIQGNYIERASLDKASKRLVKFNKAGVDINYGVFFSQKLDTLFGKSGFSYFVNIADRLHADALFTDDLFSVLFYGNKSFEDDTAEMGSFNSNYLHYQQLEIGLIKMNENKSVLGFGASFLKGQEFYQVNIARANLYTSTSGIGLYNELDILYGTVESDPSKKKITDMSGWGISVDAFYQVPYFVLQDTEEEESKWKGYLRIEAKDLGFIRWSDSSRTSILDTVLNNEGILLPSSLVLPDTWAEDQEDSLNALIEVEERRGTFANKLPGTFHLKMYQENAKGMYVTMGTILRLFANYSPMIYLGGGKKFSKLLELGGVMEFGGYGRFNLGFEARTNFNGFQLAIGSRSLGGFIFPNRAGGNSAFIGLKKTF
ncbi:MAG: hypothetical protein JKX73_03285 [Flavobacteriales bacterium]|nr:hypothetical protein [Flavobacteriales bacterium]